MILLLAACGHGQNQPLAAPPLYAPVAAQPDSAFVTRGAIRSVVVLPGITRLPTMVVFPGSASGRIAQIHAWPGDFVEEGQLLATLDSSQLQQQISNLQNRIEHMQSSFELQSQEMSLQIQIMQNSGDPSLSLARLDLDHLQRRHALDMTEATTMLDNLLVNLNDMEIRAATNGQIVYTELVGTWVGANDAVMYIAKDAPSEVFVEYIGMSAPVIWFRRDIRMHAAIGDKTYEIELMPLSPAQQLHYASRDLDPPVRFMILADADDLPPAGLSVFIRLYNHWVDDALRIPNNALYRSWPDTNYVYRIEDGQQTRVDVTVGEITISYVEILEGLNEGDEVFVRP